MLNTNQIKYRIIGLIITVTASLPALAAHTAERMYLTVQKAQIHLLSESFVTTNELPYLPNLYNGGCSGSESKKLDQKMDPKNTSTEPPSPSQTTVPTQINPTAGGVVDSLVGSFNKIINIGKVVWDIIESNKAIINVSSQRAFAMPAETSCWSDLEYWNRPKSRTYQIDYHNLYGSSVASFEVKLIYHYGGRFNGKGRYLANVTIIPSNVKVSWGFKLNAEMITEPPINLSSHDDPIAGMEASITWQVESVLSKQVQSLNLFIDGNGNIDQL